MTWKSDGYFEVKVKVKFLLLPLVLLLCSCAGPHSDPATQASAYLAGMPPALTKSFKKQYHNGPNFNKDDYIFTYICNGGFICADVYVPSVDNFFGFPDMYESVEANAKAIFKLTFNNDSNQICISGISGLEPDKIYQNECYRFEKNHFNKMSSHE